jgi:acetylornithine deacetylase/succinyl-diaminopimelate desuccinylase-like protein
MTASLVLLISLPIWGQSAIDWNSQRAEIVNHYRTLIQIDTRAGNESRAVDYLRRVLEAEGIATKAFALDPARANLVARLRGNGSKRPILVLAHTDVVGVQPDKWPVPPFSAALKDGYVWGRGSVDDKSILVADLMVMLLLKRSGMTLDRDVIFLAESGEEANPEVGINFMVEKHYDEIEAEFSLTEMGGGILRGGKVVRMDIATAEKRPARVRLVATGTSGHGSAPRTDNPLVHLAAAVEKVGRWQTPMRFNETTRSYFKKLASVSPPELAARYDGLFREETREASESFLREADPRAYSMLRTSVAPTMLKAGVGVNVIPSEAEATLDIRALPDENIQNFYSEMARLINDPAVKIVPLPESRPPSPASSLDSEMYHVLERVSNDMYPGVTVVPTMWTGASDKAQLRAKGQQSYGIGPISTPEDRTNHGSHTDVERLPESSVYELVEFVWRAVTAVAAARH